MIWFGLVWYELIISSTLSWTPHPQQAREKKKKKVIFFFYIQMFIIFLLSSPTVICNLIGITPGAEYNKMIKLFYKKKKLNKPCSSINSLWKSTSLSSQMKAKVKVMQVKENISSNLPNGIMRYFGKDSIS